MGSAALKAATHPLQTGVDLFFVISGFVIALPVLSSRAPRIGAFAFARAVRIYPLAILTAAIFAAGNWLTDGSYRDELLPGFITSALLVPAPYMALPVVLWTLKQEVLFYLLFIVVLINRKTGFALIFAWCAASLALSHGRTTDISADPLGMWLFHGKNVGFGLGVLACIAWRRFPLGRAWSALAAAGGTALLLAAAYGLDEDVFRTRTLLVGLGAAALVYAMACAPVKRLSPLLLLGTASYSIYLIHMLAIPLCKRLPLELSAPAGFALLTVMGVALGLAYYGLLERPLEAWRKRLRSTASVVPAK